MRDRFLNLAAHVLAGDFNKQDGSLDERALRDQVFRWANYAETAANGLFDPVPDHTLTIVPVALIEGEPLRGQTEEQRAALPRSEPHQRDDPEERSIATGAAPPEEKKPRGRPGKTEEKGA